MKTRRIIQATVLAALLAVIVYVLIQRFTPIADSRGTPNDCGPQALAAALREYRINALPESIAALAGTDAEGTTMLGLRDAAVALGVKAEGMRLSYSGLESRLDGGASAIAFVNRDHYVWIKKLHPLGLVVKDVAPGFKFYSKSDWCRIWFEDAGDAEEKGEGLCLVLSPPDEMRSTPRSYKPVKVSGGE